MPEKKKKRKPWWMRRQVSCPDCGFVFGWEYNSIFETGQKYINCPRCNTRYSSDEFFSLNWDKYSYKMAVEDLIDEDM